VLSSSPFWRTDVREVCENAFRQLSDFPFCELALTAIFSGMSRIEKLLIVSLAIVFFCACNAQQPSRPVKLPSGRTIKLLGIVRMNFPKGPPALMLKYETDLKISDVEALRKEWTRFSKFSRPTLRMDNSRRLS
jgi:hypothetical protein